MITNVNKIDSTFGSYTNQTTAKRPQKPLAKTDQVSFSATAQDFNTAREALAKIPDIRTQRVKELSAQIEAGRYNISSQDIATKIIETKIAQTKVLEGTPWRA